MSANSPIVTAQVFELVPFLRDGHLLNFGDSEQPETVRDYVEEELGFHGQGYDLDAIARTYMTRVQENASHGVAITVDAIFIPVSALEERDDIAKSLRRYLPEEAELEVRST